ncbi:MAG: hypothetical protein EAX95_07190 [Candidatus Thorarchaeota archaeon]|nr:hypothetical protein [Candidatus Thorarchaeota archaeon]
MKRFESISTQELITTWWRTPWIRYLVLALLPIGVIDVAYTLAATAIYGIEVEFNPITQLFLFNNLWLPWSIMNIVGFALFCMLAGSYYLITRNQPAGPNTMWLSLILALRIGLAAYNVTYFYIPFLVTIYPPLWVGLFMFIITFALMDKLLTRRDDITKRSVKSFFTVRLSNIHDRKLIKTASAGSKPVKVVKEEVLKTALQKSTWAKRGAYLTLSILMIVAMAGSIEVIGVFSGLINWSDANVPYFVFTEFTSRWFLVTVISIMVFLSFSMYFIIKAFDTTEQMQMDMHR